MSSTIFKDVVMQSRKSVVCNVICYTCTYKIRMVIAYTSPTERKADSHYADVVNRRSDFLSKVINTVLFSFSFQLCVYLVGLSWSL